MATKKEIKKILKQIEGKKDTYLALFNIYQSSCESPEFVQTVEEFEDWYSQSKEEEDEDDRFSLDEYEYMVVVRPEYLDVRNFLNLTWKDLDEYKINIEFEIPEDSQFIDFSEFIEMLAENLELDVENIGLHAYIESSFQSESTYLTVYDDNEKSIKIRISCHEAVRNFDFDRSFEVEKNIRKSEAEKRMLNLQYEILDYIKYIFK